MKDQEFRLLLDLLIVLDPWPLKENNRDVLLQMLDAEAVRRGFKHAHDAYHRFNGNQAPRVVRI
jgi:hypothetical protein